MKRVIYSGPEAEISRFGYLKDGDVLLCTEGEARGVLENPFFKLFSGKAIPKPRNEKLAFENDAERVRFLELDELTVGQLVAIAQSMRQAGSRIEWRPHDSKRQMVHCIAKAWKLDLEDKAREAPPVPAVQPAPPVQPVNKQRGKLEPVHT